MQLDREEHRAFLIELIEAGAFRGAGAYMVVETLEALKNATVAAEFYNEPV